MKKLLGLGQDKIFKKRKKASDLGKRPENAEWHTQYE